MSAKHTPVQFGMTAGADFSDNTMTLAMDPGFVVSVGPVAVMPRATYDELLEACRLLIEYQTAVESDDPAARQLEKYSAAMDTAKAAIAKATGSAA